MIAPARFTFPVTFIFELDEEFTAKDKDDEDVSL